VQLVLTTLVLASLAGAIMLAPRFVNAEIPGVIGLWLLLFPRAFTTDQKQTAKMRKWGLLLLGIACMYALMKIGGR
jgi:hypothetical protein